MMVMAHEYELDEMQYGDPRRCPRHGVTTSSADGLHDAPCGACEMEIDAADERDAWEALSPEERARYQASVSAPTPADIEQLFGDDHIPF